MPLDVSDWIDCKPEQALEPGLFNLMRTCGITINFIAGAYVTNSPIFHPWTGGVMWVDWSLANIQESPLVLEKYYRDLEKPYVWWSDLRHEPPGLANQMKWMGLHLADKMVGLCFDMARFRMHQRKEKFDVFMVQEPKDNESFSHLFEKCFDYSSEFKKEAISFFKDYNFKDRILHHLGYYRGHPVCIGTYTAFVDHALIMNLGTDPKHRGNGFGTLMLENLLAGAYSHDLRYVFAIVRESEAPFFLARGFEKKVDFNVFASEEVIRRWPKSTG